MRKLINKKSEKGFTLVEVLVAVAILSMLGIGLLGALTGASKTLLKADTRESARDLAQAQMEYVQNLGYDVNPANYLTSSDIDDQYPGYTSIIEAPTIVKDGLQKVTIVVSQGTEEKFRLEGYKVDY
jgi:prepilin-type N-terminal cleavage/methylation domain-containing protein